MNKVVFISENPVQGKVPRDFENARTEFSWSIALDADWLPIGQTPTKEYDLGIVIVPKTNPNVNIDLYKNFCVNISVMQEGPHWYFQDYSVEKQFHYINTLRSADWVYCHNEYDVDYYRGIGCRDVRVMRSLMIPDGLDSQVDKKDKQGILLGGNFTSWYSGIDSYLVASEVEDKKYCPSMGRRQKDENLLPDVEFLPYMNWREWINHIGQYKVGVHMMRTHAAGTFSMNLAYHGIPVIGYYGLDTQEKLHPDLCIPQHDMRLACRLMSKLYNDEDFYNHCSKTAYHNFEKYYSEEAWLKNWKKENK